MDNFLANFSGTPISCCPNTGRPAFLYLRTLALCSLANSDIVDILDSKPPCPNSLISPPKLFSIAFNSLSNALNSLVLSTIAFVAFANTAGIFLVKSVWPTAPFLPTILFAKVSKYFFLACSS